MVALVENQKSSNTQLIDEMIAINEIDIKTEDFSTLFDGVGTDVINGTCTGCGGTVFFAINVAVS